MSESRPACRARDIAVIVAVIGALFFSGGVGFGTSAARSTPAAAVSTYTTTFYETGLPNGTTWSVTFNGTTSSSSTGSISFASIPGGQSYFWTISSPIAALAWGEQYAPTVTSGGMQVPEQLSQEVVFQLEYLLQVASNPVGDASLTPAGPTYFPAGSEVTVEAVPIAGYTVGTFTSVSLNSKWIVFQGGSAILRLGAPSNVTIKLHAQSYVLSFNESGLLPGTSWNVTVGSTTYNTTASSLSILEPAGYYSYSVATMVEDGGLFEWVPSVPYGYFYPPFLTSAQIVYTDWWLVNFTVPSGAASGFTIPSSSAYYPSTYPHRLPVKVFVDAVSSSTTNFSTWSVKKKGDATFYSTTSDSTAAFVARAGATLQANFVPGTPCSSNCKVTFTEIGIPSTIHGIQVPWGVTFNGSFLGGSFTSISVNGVNSSAVSGSWSVPSPIYSGTPGLYFVATSASGYLYLPYQTSQLIQYVEEAYVVFSVDPLYSGPSVTPSTGLYPIGDNVSISSMGTQSYGFSRWTTSNGSVLSLLAASSASTDLEVTGPGWVNATFSPRMQAVTFTQFGLPAGAVWGVTFNGNYYSAVVKFIGKATTSTLSIPSMPAGSYFWSVTSPIAATRPGEQYAATIPDAVLTDFTDAGQVVVFVTQVRVAFAATGTAGGSILPSTAAFYDDGSTIAISAINGSSATFVSWSASNSGTLFGSTSQPSTYAGIVAPTIIRGSFS